MARKGGGRKHMDHRIVSFGMIGCGTISEWHAQAIEKIDGARLVAVTDLNEAARAAFAQKYQARAFDSVEALLAEPSIDVVSICTPSGLHAPLAVQAAGRGKNIVVEKPMAITPAQLDAVMTACRVNHVKLSVIAQLRFSDAVRQLNAAVGDGALGRLVMADLSMKYYRSQEYYDRGGWRGTWKMDGGGALMNQGIHGVDLMQYVMGPVKSVCATVRTLTRRIEVEDTAVATLEFQNGALGRIAATTSVYPGSPRTLEICGDRGTIRLEEDSIASWDIAGRQLPEGVRLGGASSHTAVNPAAFGIEGHFRQLSDMVDAIRNDRAPLVDQFEGKRSVELILAIYESSKTEKTVCL